MGTITVMEHLKLETNYWQGFVPYNLTTLMEWSKLVKLSNGCEKWIVYSKQWATVK